MLLALVLAAPGVSGAMTSGPDIAEILGLDPATHLVYAKIDHLDESGDLSTLVTLDLRKHGGQLPRKIAGSHVSGGVKEWSHADSLLNARIAALRRRLTPPHLWSGEVFRDYEVIATDSVLAGSMTFPRFRIRVPGNHAAGKGELEVTVYKRPVVAFGSYCTFPGERAVVALVSYFPLAPYDCDCETQVPIVLPGGDDPILRIDGAPPR
jgi:hypothetical protein